MEIVKLSARQLDQIDPNCARAVLLKDMIAARDTKSRVYRLYVNEPKQDNGFVLTMTSKDLLLKLSSYDWQTLYHFAFFLEEEFVERRCSHFLLCIKDESQNSEEGVYVTRIVEGKVAIFSLASAR